MTTIQDYKSKLTQAIDKIIMQKIEEEIGKGFKTYIEKLEQDYDSESEDELKDIISIRRPAIKNPVTTNDM
ncbi:7499_t:CDS:2 [Ambispora leptoticha]|uniref:7499_t:CDS:1 n=1 Tax=Ambispora leptoticha TaxID=144679 RepID=A0A9N8Z607_9GLOM|nr:7499_t:CDS:2 [Ambispora leptoticha]